MKKIARLLGIAVVVLTTLLLFYSSLSTPDNHLYIKLGTTFHQINGILVTCLGSSLSLVVVSMFPMPRFFNIRLVFSLLICVAIVYGIYIAQEVGA